MTNGSGGERLALLCPGQGGQAVGMLRLVQGEAAAHPVLAALGKHVPPEVLAAAVGEGTSPSVDLFQNAVAQPLVVACALAHWAALAHRGLPAPVVWAGYSVGELSAHGGAGTFGNPDTALRLARVRAAAMDEAATTALPEGGGGLLALKGLPDPVLDAITREAGLEPAIDNGPGHRVLGGPTAAVEAGARLARERAMGGTVRVLRVGIPAHTRWLAGASVAFERALRATDDLRAPGRPVLAGVDAALVWDVARTVDTLARQLREPVRWAGCLRAAWELGARVFLELPPGDGLSRIAREVLPAGAEIRALDEFRTLTGAVTWAERRLG